MARCGRLLRQGEKKPRVNIERVNAKTKKVNLRDKGELDERLGHILTVDSSVNQKRKKRKTAYTKKNSQNVTSIGKMEMKTHRT